ncbi:heparan-alpha-glucosaminide N-acetyltransferase [Scleropages formosus]|uniref:heparan-alpha-glucosaminide N-acetyltransferase n=1 Tax=Scleropages formosus TaxID=113540 RepID=UPI0010FAAEAD|nr:heparan-alpha-glucosaminide N-acetyltransferase-like [Scleropages formosus]
MMLIQVLGGPLKEDLKQYKLLWSLSLDMDQALLTIYNQLQSRIRVSYVNDHCYRCLYQPLVSLNGCPSNSSVVISTRFSLSFTVEAENASSVCSWSKTYGEAGRYLVWVQQSDVSTITCMLTVDKNPINSYLPILVAALILALLALVAVSVPYLLRFGSHDSMSEDGGCGEQAVQTKSKSSRLKSLDTFRGFSLTLMVFVNYEGGGYWFFLHIPWNGLTVADCVMPWFVFIMGTSIVLAFNVMWRRGVSRLQLLRKVTWRSVVLFLIGVCFMNYSARDGLLSWSWARIPGVLQRLGFTYFVLSLIHMWCLRKEIPLKQHNWWNPLQDIVLYWPEWIVILLLEILWLCLTFLLPVPGCPRGYLGAGGIGDNGMYPNCSGGAAGYIDRWLFGQHIYKYPTFKEMYQTTQSFDPEGVLGTINCIVIGFAGMQAGKIILYFRSRNFSILKRFLIWAILLGILAAILTKCTRDKGFIPVNKNLWSLSFISCTGCFAFLLLGCLYFVIDVKGWWGGQPFIYPGMNSILVYVGHTILGYYFPFSWEMARPNHAELLFKTLLGTVLWILISYLLYRKRFFLKI